MKNFVTICLFPEVNFGTVYSSNFPCHVRLKSSCLFVAAAQTAESERNNAISRIADLEEELKFAKSSTDELKKVQDELKSLEAAGQAHDDDLTALLEPIVTNLSGKITRNYLDDKSLRVISLLTGRFSFHCSAALGASAILPNQIREDAPMDNITRLEAHVTKAKGVLSDVTGLLSEVFEQLLPREPLPPTLPEIVQKLTPISALLDEFTLAKTKARARATITFATTSGIEGDYEKAYADFPKQPDGKKVQLKNYAERSGKLADRKSVV